MPTFKVKVHMEYPSTVITECVEVNAESLDQAIELAENGDGFLISEEIEFGEAASTTVVPATFNSQEN